MQRRGRERALTPGELIIIRDKLKPDDGDREQGERDDQ
jgi:hypothetical protein